MSINKDEYGQILYINVGEDLTGTTLTLILEPKEGDEITRAAADGLTIGTTNITVDGVQFNANEYAYYTIKSGDLDYAGFWRYKLKVKFSATKELSTNYQRIKVMP